MNIPGLLIQRFDVALATLTDEHAKFAEMIRASTDAQFGDYQCNAAMPLSKKLGQRNAREVAEQIVANLDVHDFCEPPTVAGPGFINLRLRDGYLADGLLTVANDERLGVTPAAESKKVLVDFSSPNVAKPMHVGHIRSTVIGDSLTRLLRFLGDRVITDNHLGDWGTQFGIIIYGYKHFGDAEKVAANPVPELAALYRLTNQLIEYHKARRSVDQLEVQIQQAREDAEMARQAAEDADATDQKNPKETKKLRKAAASASARLQSIIKTLESTQAKIDAVDSDAELASLAGAHENVGQAVLQETAKLHQGNPENLELWRRFLPHCKDEINRIYDRLQVQFDHTLGESFYHDRLPGVVETLSEMQLTTVSDGAVCVFVDGFESPMIVQKSDGAYLYATTDLATLQYRAEAFQTDEILYVVDSRQSEHFEKFFSLAPKLNLGHIRLEHIQFGTVLGRDGRPMKTRSGSLVGLESLLNEAVDRAREIACDPARLAQMSPPIGTSEQHRIAEVVGMGAIKYADLSHHRASDYKFDIEKMVALDGNTATYIQYSYARTQSILRKAGQETDLQALVAELTRQDTAVVTAVERILAGERLTAVTTEPMPRFEDNRWSVELREPAERALAFTLLRFEEALRSARSGYAPNAICDYLYETAKTYSVFNEGCRVLGNEDPVVSQTRLLLVSLTGRVLRCGLSLLGIGVVPRM